MAKRTVQNILSSPAGAPLVDRQVTVQLSVPSFDTGHHEIVSVTRALTDATGQWSVQLEVNADLEPSGSFYTVTELENLQWSFAVPAGDPDAPAWLRECLISDPQPGVVAVLGGMTGATGAQGPAGAAGPQGEVGPAGAGIDPASDQTITGQWAFADSAAPTTASVSVPTYDLDTGEPIPGTGFILTATAPGSNGNVGVLFDMSAPDQTLGAAVMNDGDNGDVLRITVPTDSGGAQIAGVPAASVVTAINASSAASRVVASLPSGSSGSDHPLDYSNFTGSLTGGSDPQRVRIRAGSARSALRVEPDELDAVPVTIRTADGSKLGVAAINVEYRDGEPLRTVNGYTYGVSHLDNDGGGGFAGDRITWSQHGQVVIDAPAGQPPLTLKSGGVGMASFGGAAALFAASTAPDQPTIQLATCNPDQTADTISAYGLDNDSKAFRVRPDGAVITMGGEPADADLAPGQCAWWFDPTPGAARVRFKGKDTAGTVVDLTPPA